MPKNKFTYHDASNAPDGSYRLAHYLIKVPQVSHEILRTLQSCPAKNKPLFEWKAKVGDRLSHYTVVGQFNLKGTLIGGDYVVPIQMPHAGELKALPKTFDDPYMFTFQPLFKEEETYEYRRHHEGLSKESFEEKLSWMAFQPTTFQHLLDGCWVIGERQDANKVERMLGATGKYHADERRRIEAAAKELNKSPSYNVS